MIDEKKINYRNRIARKKLQALCGIGVGLLLVTGCGKKEAQDIENAPEKLGTTADSTELAAQESTDDSKDNSTEYDWYSLMAGETTLFDMDGKEITIKDLPEYDDDYEFVFADVDNDDEDELCFRTRVSLYVINNSDGKFSVIYEGTSSYDYPVDTEDKHGIYYYFSGAAPVHYIYKFTEIDNDGNVLSSKMSSEYDANENGIMDPEDMYCLGEDEEPLDYSKWYESEDNPNMHRRPSVNWMDSRVRDVTWNNDASEADQPEGNTIVTFTLKSGTVTSMDTQSEFLVDSLDFFDLDNDGVNEYVVKGHSSLISYDHSVMYIYKIQDDKVELLFPAMTGIDEIDGATLGCAYSNILNEDKTSLFNALNVIAYKEDESSTYSTYLSFEGKIYYRDGKWNIGKARIITEESDLESGNDQIDEEIKSTVKIEDGTKLEFTEWVDDEHTVYRVGIQRDEISDTEYQHLEDYFFVLKDESVISFKVDYPSKSDDMDSDRYVFDACDFDAEYIDVTEDGNEDMIISLGHQGNRGTITACAYVYNEGGFVYTKTFEDIPNYDVSCGDGIRGMITHNAVSFSVMRYKYENGEFVEVESKEFSWV